MPEIIEFLDSQGRNLFRLLYRVTLREDVAEDLMQELFLKLQASDAFPTATCPMAFARRTALHLAFDWRRKRRNSTRAESADNELPDDRPSPLEKLIEAEQIQAVLDAMTGLSNRNCELLTLHYIEQQSYETLAEAYGKTSHQIRALCHKSLVQLRELLSDVSHESARGEGP